MSAAVTARLNWFCRACDALDAMRARLEHASETAGSVFTEDEEQDVVRCLEGLEAVMGAARSRLEAERAAYYARFERQAVLQPLVRCGGQEKRIVAHKPHPPKRDEPYVSEAYYDTLLARMGGRVAVNLDGYDIEVVSARGHAVGRISAGV